MNLRPSAGRITALLALTFVAGCQGAQDSATPEPTARLDHAAPQVPPPVPTSAAARALLTAGQYAGLDAQYTAVQRAYEAGALSDVALRDAFRAFYPTDAALAERYAEWVKAFPTSYVARLARGIYYKKVGIDRRGEASAAETSEAQFDGMRTAFDSAGADLYASMKMTAKPLLSYLHAIDLNNYVSEREECKHLLEQSLQVDPHNFVVRLKYMVTLENRWGGSTEELASFIEESRRAGIAGDQLRELQSVAAEDEAWVLKFVKHDQSAAADAYLKANALSANEGCTRCAADSLMKAGRYKEAVDLYTKILATEPDAVYALNNRAYSHVSQGQFTEAVPDLERSAALGDAWAQTALGDLYVKGGAVPQNRAKGIEYLRKAAAQGFAPAKDELAFVTQSPGASPAPSSAH